MSDDKRRQLEELLLSGVGGAQRVEAAAGEAGGEVDEQLVAQLQGLGFGWEDARMGAAAAANGGAGREPLQAALDWLCLSLPEQRLPRTFAASAGSRPVIVRRTQQPAGSADAGLTAAQQLQQEEERRVCEAAEAALLDPVVSELVAYGYPVAAASDAVAAAGGQLAGAHAALLAQLCPEVKGLASAGAAGEAGGAAAAGQLPEAWQEEVEALSAIFEQELALPSPCHAALSMDLEVRRLCGPAGATCAACNRSS